MKEKHAFLLATKLSMSELAAIRGVSRQYCTRDIDIFSKNKEDLRKLYQSLSSTNTGSSLNTAKDLLEYCSANNIDLVEESPKEAIIKFIKNELTRISFSQDISKQIETTREYLKYLEIIDNA